MKPQSLKALVILLFTYVSVISLNYTAVDTRADLYTAVPAWWLLSHWVSIGKDIIEKTGKYVITRSIPLPHTHTPFLFILLIFICSAGTSLLFKCLFTKSFSASRRVWLFSLTSIPLFCLCSSTAIMKMRGWVTEWAILCVCVCVSGLYSVFSCSPDCRLLRLSERGQLSCSPPDLTPETRSSQSRRSSSSEGDNQSKQHHR